MKEIIDGHERVVDLSVAIMSARRPKKARGVVNALVDSSSEEEVQWQSRPQGNKQKNGGKVTAAASPARRGSVRGSVRKKPAQRRISSSESEGEDGHTSGSGSGSDDEEEEEEEELGWHMGR
jgi:hypothetical protein